MTEKIMERRCISGGGGVGMEQEKYFIASSCADSKEVPGFT